MINFLGKWESDTDIKATCKKDKVEILEYCKKVQISLFKDTKNKKDKSGRNRFCEMKIETRNVLVYIF